MGASSPCAPTAVPVASAVTHGDCVAEFVDLLIGDDDWVAQEFEALVEAGWGGDVPDRPEPLQGPRWPRRPGHVHRPAPDAHPRPGMGAWSLRAQQRGPPCAVRAL
jgi:hypothetical protein